jgi:hypothetical protein
LVSQLQKIAIELLRARRKTGNLYKNWTQGFLCCYPDLKARFVLFFDKDCILAEDPEQIQQYFDLFCIIKAKYNIYNNNIYNIDKKGVIIKVLTKFCIICSRKNKKLYTIQQESQK